MDIQKIDEEIARFEKKKAILFRLIASVLFCVGLAGLLTVTQRTAETSPPADLGSFLLGVLASLSLISAGIGIFLLSFKKTP